MMTETNTIKGSAMMTQQNRWARRILALLLMCVTATAWAETNTVTLTAGSGTGSDVTLNSRNAPTSEASFTFVSPQKITLSGGSIDIDCLYHVTWGTFIYAYHDGIHETADAYDLVGRFADDGVLSNGTNTISFTVDNEDFTHSSIIGSGDYCHSICITINQNDLNAAYAGTYTGSLAYYVYFTDRQHHEGNPIAGSIPVELIILDCTVSFDTRGKGTAPTPQTVSTGQTVTEPALRSYHDDTDGKDYCIEGWYTDAGCTEAYDFDMPVNRSFTLYAKWVEAGHYRLETNGEAAGTVTLTDAKGRNLTASGLFVPGQCTLTVSPASGYEFTGTYALPDRSTMESIMPQTINGSSTFSIPLDLTTKDLGVSVTFSENTTYKVFVTTTTIGNATEGTFTLEDSATPEQHSYTGGEELAKVYDESEESWPTSYDLTLTVNNIDLHTVYAATVTNKNKKTYIHNGMRSYTFTPKGNVNIHLYFFESMVDEVITDNSASNGWGPQIVNAGLPHMVGLAGRTLYKDGNWNTLCLPFPLMTLEGTPLEGATVMKLNTTSQENNSYKYKTRFDEESGTLNLYFTSVTSIEAGQPYIVKWKTTDDPITSPSFPGVFITATEPASVTSNDGKISFCGTYNYTKYDSENRSILFLGEANTLYFPQPSGLGTDNPTYPSIGACHAYFQLNGISAADPSDPNLARRFVLNFEDSETTGIISIENGKLKIENEAGAWYDLSGRRLSGKPTRPGIYIENGRKLVIK